MGMKLVHLSIYAAEPLRSRQVDCIERFEAPSSGDSVAHQISSNLTYSIVVLGRYYDIWVGPEGNDLLLHFGV